MPINDSFTIPEPVLRYLMDGERSFLGLRLTFGVLYGLNKSLQGNMQLVPAQRAGARSMRTSEIAAAVGPEKARDNRWIHQGCIDLAGQGLFKEVQVVGRRVQFALSSKFLAPFSKPSAAFVILYTDQIRQCRTLHDLMFLALASQHSRKDRPLFYLPRISERSETAPVDRAPIFPPQSPTEQTWRVSWGASSRAWINAAIRTSRILNHSYLIAPNQDLIDDHITSVVVKIQHGETKWEPRKLYHVPARTRSVIEIPADGKKAVLNMGAVRSKAYQTIIM